MYTSDSVRSLARFGYAYPELPDWGMNETELQIQARQQINRWYNPFLFPPQKRSTSRPLRRAPNLAIAFRRISMEDAQRLGVNNVNRQWFAKVRIDRFAYKTSFALYFFMGDPPPDPRTWPTASNLVGTQGQFINGDVDQMHPEGRPAGSIEGEVSLTHTIVAGMNRGHISSLSPADVLPVLTSGLQWRARAADGCEVNCEELSGLLVSVGSRPVQPAKDEYCFPKHGDVQWHGEVTAGKVGGATQYYRLAEDPG
jgi:tyrosinase